MFETVTHNAKETAELGEKLAERIKGGDIIAYRGDLGMGKTVFTGGLAKGLGITADVSSPTFSLINEYRGGRVNLCHMDAYRLNSMDDLLDTGFYDYIDSGWAAAVEWSERLELEADFTVTFERVDDNTRRITVEGREL